MSLEKVKAGDPVWRKEYKTFGEKIIALETVESVTANYIRLKGHGKDTWYRSNGWPRGHASYWLHPATAEEIAAWEAEQAQKKADREAQEAAQQRERDEKRVMLQELAVDLDLPPHDVNESGIYFSYRERRYRITEED